MQGNRVYFWGFLSKSKELSTEGWESWWLFRFMTCREHDMGPKTDFVQAICKTSSVASMVFFCGGFYRFSSAWKQRLYLWIFLSSFVLCFLSCSYNLYIQTAPFYDYATGSMTVYFHVFGLHCWLFWRGFIKQQARRTADEHLPFSWVVLLRLCLI